MVCPDTVGLSWYSREEAAKQVEVLGIENNKDGIVRVSLGVVSVPDPGQIGGFFYSSIDLAQSDRFSGYMVRVVEGGKQIRLVLRSMSAGSKNEPHEDPLARLAREVSRSSMKGSVSHLARSHLHWLMQVPT